MLRITRVLPLFIVAVVAIGCQPNIVERKNVIAMIDYSGTIKPETLNIYATTIADNVFGNLSQSDKMILIPIDEASKIEASQLLYHDLNQQGFDKDIRTVTERENVIKERLDKYKRENRDAVFNTVIEQKERRKQYTKLTDILSAIEQAALKTEHFEPPSSFDQFLDSVSGTSEMKSENVILIFSDMIHESSDLNFLSLAFDEKLVNKTIADLKAQNRIPNLKGTKVFVCGRTGKTNAMIDGIHSFWKRYFAEAHADLKAYDYDSGKVISEYLKF